MLSLNFSVSNYKDSAFYYCIEILEKGLVSSKRIFFPCYNKNNQTFKQDWLEVLGRLFQKYFVTIDKDILNTKVT